jgi:hypothetical protein
VAEGHGWPGNGEGKRQLGELSGGAFGARRKGSEVELGGETGCQAAAGGASSKCQLWKRR